MLTAFLLSAILFLAVALAMLAVTHYEARLDTAHLHRLLDAKDEAADPFNTMPAFDDQPELPFDPARYNKD